jgi:hypothetical protein
VAETREQPPRIEPTERFVIDRDLNLGKPLVSWRSPPKDAEGRRGIDILEQFFMVLHPIPGNA